MCNSNKGTGGMESRVVLFKPRILLFACTHPSVSTSLDCNDWLAYKHQSTALCSNTWFLAVYKHQSPPCVSNIFWIVVTCLRTRISLQPCVSNTFGLWSLVCLQALVSIPLFQTRLIMVACLFTSISLEPKWPRHGSDGDPTPRGVGFRLSPDLPSRPHQNEGDT